MKAKRPLVHREMAIFHDGADSDRKRLAASVALAEARPMRLALNKGGVSDDAAMRADWLAIRPALRLKVGAGCILVMEDRISQVGGHGNLLCPEHRPNALLCQVHNALFCSNYAI